MPPENGATLRSRITTDGLDRAPHRAFLRGMGLDDAAIARPFIGVASTAGEVTPCNMTLGPQAAQAKIGVEKAGGTPREFTTISVSDGLSMNHQGMKFSLISREIIADSVEAVRRDARAQGCAFFRRHRSPPMKWPPQHSRLGMGSVASTRCPGFDRA